MVYHALACALSSTASVGCWRRAPGPTIPRCPADGQVRSRKPQPCRQYGGHRTQTVHNEIWPPGVQFTLYSLTRTHETVGIQEQLNTRGKSIERASAPARLFVGFTALCAEPRGLRPLKPRGLLARSARPCTPHSYFSTPPVTSSAHQWLFVAPFPLTRVTVRQGAKIIALTSPSFRYEGSVVSSPGKLATAVCNLLQSTPYNSSLAHTCVARQTWTTRTSYLVV